MSTRPVLDGSKITTDTLARESRFGRLVFSTIGEWHDSYIAVAHDILPDKVDAMICAMSVSHVLLCHGV